MSDEDDLDIITSRRFEAVKIAMSQDKNGFVLKLSVHPNDAPEELLRDPVGSRYMVVAVKLGDDEQPIPAEKKKQIDTVVQMAGMLCADERFQAWLVRTGLAEDVSEEAAVNSVREYCAVASRSELKINEKARDRFLALRAEFADDLRRGTNPR
jgi:hypothetical protein